ncbi:DNA-binding transcriptional activator of the SARP family [Nonomuraea solani]|uniref:DNA-binding transcriptional activator of the SARP family n=1 Tax=Nonomuraea solani TaxID=1144553 RepID=A0A1H6A709_9ACTN|nr:BTAD domain-containing putative transcriptional regulator [Nonomuraea solani]SEG44152.1 DNA-binding transcriptional activator of the SARP family [Nonomuraea solani]
MEFRLLGPVEVWHADRRLAVGGPKPRALLAALLLGAGQVVPVSRLVELIWDDHAPDTARALIQTYVSSLRRGLSPGGEPNLIETRPPGYLLRLEGTRLDLDVFERLLAKGRRAAGAQRHEETARLLREAEALWRGPALGGIGEALSAEAARLDELRLSAIEERVAAELLLDRHAELVPELTALVGAHPDRERVRGHLMMALYRLGRSAEALAVYEDGRAALADRLGIDPGPHLQELHQAILRGDTTLLLGGHSPPIPHSDPTTPATAAWTSPSGATARTSPPSATPHGGITPPGPQPPTAPEAAPPTYATSEAAPLTYATSEAAQLLATDDVTPPRPPQSGAQFPRGPDAQPGTHSPTTPDAAQPGEPPATQPATQPATRPPAEPGSMRQPRPLATWQQAPPVVPAQLPPDVPDFTGRTALISDLIPLLTSTGGAAPPVLVISGKGGVGKSTLAVHIAHRAAGRYPDGQLYADLRGTSDTPATAHEILGRFLRALGIESTALPESPQDRADLYRSVLAQRRVLLVLDDARGERQIRPLLPGGGGCAVLVTSRGRLAGLAGAQLTDLDVLDADSALILLASIAGSSRVAAEPDAARTIVGLCGLLPLAVRTAGARLATRRHWTLATMTGRLADEHRRLDELAAGDLEVRASVSLSYRLLDEQAKAAFRRLGLLGVPDFASWIAAPLLDVSADAADDVIERLMDAQLVDFAAVDATGRARYRLHDLLRVFATECAVAYDDLEDRDAALSRTLGSWLWLITQAGARSPSGEVELRAEYASARPVDDRISAEVLADPAAWLEAETPALIVAVARAAAFGLDVAACDLAAALSFSHVFMANRLNEWRTSHDAALAAARRAGNRLGEAALLAGLGQIHYKLDRFEQVYAHLSQALPLFTEAGDVRGEAVVQAGMGSACREHCRLREGLDHLAKSAAIFHTLGDDSAIGYTARTSAAIHLELGEYQATWPLLEQAMLAYRRAGSRRGEALTLRTRGLVHRALGDYAEAERLSGEALDLLRDSGDRLMIAFAVQALVKAQLRQGRGTGALPSLLDALEVCRRHFDRYGEALMQRTIGELHLSCGRLELAEDHLTQAIAISEALHTPLPAARARRDLAAVRAASGDSAGAASLLAAAMAVFVRHDAREQHELAHLDPGTMDLHELTAKFQRRGPDD